MVFMVGGATRHSTREMIARIDRILVTRSTEYTRQAFYTFNAVNQSTLHSDGNKMAQYANKRITLRS